MHASETMRRMATLQLQEMQIATGGVPDTAAADKEKGKQNKGVFGGFFRRSKVDNNSAGKVEEKEKGGGEKRIQYKPDSFLGKTKRESKKQQGKYDEGLDPAMQNALVSSMSGKSRKDHLDAELERALALSFQESGGPGKDGKPRRRSSDMTPQRGSRDRMPPRRSSDSGSSDSGSRDTTPQRRSSDTTPSRDTTPQRRSSDTTPSRDTTPQRAARSASMNDSPPRASSREGSSHHRTEGSSHHRHHGEGSSHHRSEGSSHHRSLPPSEGSTHHRSKGSSHHRSLPPSEGSTHHRHHGQESSHASTNNNSDPRPGPPAGLSPNASSDLKPLDGSIVHFEFASEEEALAMAISLSLMEAENQTKSAEPKPNTDAESIPEEAELSELTEEEQISMALKQSMTMAPPELKSEGESATEVHNANDAQEDNLKMPAVAVVLSPDPATLNDAEGKDQKMPAVEDAVSGSTHVPCLDDVEQNPQSSAEEHKQSSDTVFTSTEYVIDLNDTAEKAPSVGRGRKSPRKLRCVNKEMSGPRVRSPTRNGSREGGSRSVSPVPHGEARSRSPKCPMGEQSLRHSSHGPRTHSSKSPGATDSVRHTLHGSGTHSPRSPKRQDDGNGSVARSPRSPRAADSLRHSSHGDRSGSHSPRRTEGARSKSPTRHRDRHHSEHSRPRRRLTEEEDERLLQKALKASLITNGPAAPDLNSEENQSGDKQQSNHRRGTLDPPRQRRKLTKEEMEQRMLEKAMKASLEGQSPAPIEAKDPPQHENSKAKHPDDNQHSEHRRNTPHREHPPAHRRKLTDEEILAKEQRMLEKAMKASLTVQSPAPAPTEGLSGGSSHLRRQARKKKEEVLRKKEDQMLEQALKASLSECAAEEGPAPPTS